MIFFKVVAYLISLIGAFFAAYLALLICLDIRFGFAWDTEHWGAIMFAFLSLFISVPLAHRLLNGIALFFIMPLIAFINILLIGFFFYILKLMLF